jgi:hypothetical protein
LIDQLLRVRVNSLDNRSIHLDTLSAPLPSPLHHHTILTQALKVSKERLQA